MQEMSAGFERIGEHRGARATDAVEHRVEPVPAGEAGGEIILRLVDDNSFEPAAEARQRGLAADDCNRFTPTAFAMPIRIDPIDEAAALMAMRMPDFSPIFWCSISQAVIGLT